VAVICTPHIISGNCEGILKIKDIHAIMYVLVKVSQGSGRACPLHLECCRVSRARNQQEEGSKQIKQCVEKRTDTGWVITYCDM
jgi:hypothetical protein